MGEFSLNFFLESLYISDELELKNLIFFFFLIISKKFTVIYKLASRVSLILSQDSEGLLNPESQDRLNLILNDAASKHQRVMFQLVRHELGLIAFEIEGAFGFSDLISLEDLKYSVDSRILQLDAIYKIK